MELCYDVDDDVAVVWEEMKGGSNICLAFFVEIRVCDARERSFELYSSNSSCMTKQLRKE